MSEKLTNCQKGVFKWIDEKDVHAADRVNVFGEFAVTDNLEQEAKRHATITLDDVAIKHGVPQSDLQTYLEMEADKEESCQTMPFTLLLVISYAMMAISHGKAPNVNAVEDSISYDIGDNANFAFSSEAMGYKAMEDVNSHADFWSWMITGFLPLIFQEEYNLAENRSEPYYEQAGEVFARRDRGALLNYNRIILGVRMVQERAPMIDDNGQRVGQCKFKSLNPVYDKECIGGAGQYELEPEMVSSRRTMNPMREHWLYIHDDQEYVRQQLVSMEKERWLDAYTKKVELTLPVHNAEYGIHAIIMCNFFFSRGGHIWKAIVPLSTFTRTFDGWMQIWIDCTWLFCLVWIMGLEGHEIYGVVKEHGAKGVWTVYMGFWNAVDWLSVFSGIGILGMLYLNEVQTAIMNDELITLGKLNEETQRTKYREQGIKYFESLEVQCHYAYTFRLVMAGYPLVIALRLFKSFGSQPRLAIITNTLLSARKDLIHFLIIFMSVFFTYTIAGVVLFGRENATFTTVFRAMITCGRLTVGDFDWEYMRQIGRADAFLWLVPFTVLITLLLLNMLIAIVMDAYSDIKTSTEGEDTIWQVIAKVYKSWKKKVRGEIVAYKTVVVKLQHLELQGDEEQASKPYVDLATPSIPHFDSSKSVNGMGITSSMSNPKLDTKPTLKLSKTLAFFSGQKQEEDIGPIMTVGKLKELFPGGELSTAQAASFIKGAVAGYYNSHKETADIDEVITLINNINYKSKRLKDKIKERVNAKGLAKNNPGDVADLANEVMVELEAARQDLAEWLPEDEEDCPLPEEWLVRRPDDAEASKEKTRKNPLDDGMHGIPVTSAMQMAPEMQIVRNGLLSSVRQMTQSKGGDAKVQPLLPGMSAQLLADEHLVFSACRAAGISPKYDALRRTALGRVMKIVERDERDGTVLCKLEGVGSVWFPVAAFAPKNGESPEESNALANISAGSVLENERRLAELDAELQVGKDTVSLGIQTLNELHARLEIIRSTKKRGVEKFQEKRREAVILSRENRERRARWQEGQARLKGLTVERDEYFERVKTLVEENRELEMKLTAATERQRLGGLPRRGRD